MHLCRSAIFSYFLRSTKSSHRQPTWGYPTRQSLSQLASNSSTPTNRPPREPPTIPTNHILTTITAVTSSRCISATLRLPTATSLTPLTPALRKGRGPWLATATPWPISARARVTTPRPLPTASTASWGAGATRRKVTASCPRSRPYSPRRRTTS